MERRSGRGSRLAGLLLGFLLVAGGIALLVAQLSGFDIRFDLGEYGWPMFVILPGLALLVVGLVLDDEPGIGLTITGSIITTVGLVLSYQWATGHWASWAYAWALVAPTAVGAGMVLWGLLHLRGRVLRAGAGTLVVGIVLFLIFFGFFEGLIGLGGDRAVTTIGRSALPVALIIGGVLIILGRLWPRRPPAQPETWRGARPNDAQGPHEAHVAPPPTSRQQADGSGPVMATPMATRDEPPPMADGDQERAPDGAAPTEGTERRASS